MHHRTAGTVAAVLFTLGINASSPAFAADPAKQAERMKKMEAKMEERFTAADANHDGRLTREEAAKMPRVAKNFDQIDAAKTGFVTLDQVREFAAVKIQERRAGKSQ